jgi:DNA-binding NarL/FixJ family response regulator
MSDDVSVLIADDHEMTRMGIKATLEGHGFRVVGEAADARAAVATALNLRPALCLLDINMPWGGGIAAAARRAR